MTSAIDQAVDALKGIIAVLPLTERREFAGKISGCFAAGELTSVGGAETAGHINPLAATAEEKREKLSPLAAANALGPTAFGLVRNVMARSARLGHPIKESALVNMENLNRDLKAARDKLRGVEIDRHLEDSIQLKSDMARLSLI